MIPPRSSPASPAPLSGFLATILGASDRDQRSGALPIVSVSEREEPRNLAQIETKRARSTQLSRRGRWHGEWAELEPSRLGLGPWSAEPSEKEMAARWLDARPIVLRGVARDRLADHAREILQSGALHAALATPGSLRAFVAARLASASDRFELGSRPGSLADPERDIERVLVSTVPAAGARRRVHDLWVKSGWLSDFDGDDSLRVRVSFGQEGSDDSSRDLERQRLTAELAELCFPASALIADDPVIVPFVERVTREPILFTQHIAYWNSPEGGALFHHDAFPDDTQTELGPGQLGVCYLQLSGRTAWLALSTEDLALRVRQFAALLESGEFGWVRAQLFPRANDWRRALAILADDDKLLGEISRPGCGELCGLVNRGPEFTSFLADGGHAAVLEAGDVILLPNHGLLLTAMHSVFCADDERAFGLSLALRADRETLPE